MPTEPAGDFAEQVDRLRGHGAGLVTSAATATDLALFHSPAWEAVGCGPG
ncbi:hypothetical protein LT493_44440 [Streptomyces tricolor]|nr:hypothetical protein [Streptomyces tricolor]